MKITLKGMIFGFLLISFSFSIGIAADVRPTVAILDFESVGSEEHLGKAVAEIMRTELIGTRNSGWWKDRRSTRHCQNNNSKHQA